LQNGWLGPTCKAFLGDSQDYLASHRKSSRRGLVLNTALAKLRSCVNHVQLAKPQTAHHGATGRRGVHLIARVIGGGVVIAGDVVLGIVGATPLGDNAAARLGR
jgi:hypothetical protein